MFLFRKIKDLQDYLDARRAEGRSIALVPTMGALHAGHTSLISRAHADGHLCVCSIFVNPTQFNEKADYEQYPSSPEADIALLAESGCDVLFMPPPSEVYPQDGANSPAYDFGYLETILEGAMRPGHFRGVGQVVARLIEIIGPQYLYMGEKDYQQCMVVSELLRQLGHDGQLQLIACPTVREADGLAMSSRNRRLTEPQRALAGIIYQCLVSIQSKKGNTSFPVVQKECLELMTAKGLAPEYVALADARNLRLLDDYQEDLPMVALIATRLGPVRLIDNMRL